MKTASERISGRRSLVVLTLLATMGWVTAEPAIAPSTSMERMVDGIVKVDADRPGAVVAVLKNGEVVFAKAYGMADLTYGVPFSRDTRSNLGSTSKQFTAFAVGLLASQGRLSWDDDVRKHIPDLPDFGDRVTLRHLLTHTSGYREIYQTLSLAGRRPFEDHVDRGEVIEVVKRQRKLQNAPGAHWNYNNTGYGLLSLVVERVTGRSFPDWMSDNLFIPLGMTNTVVRSDPSVIVRNSARGYVPGTTGYREARDLGAALGASAVYTTVGDLALWMRNFRTGELGAGIFNEMTTRYSLTTGETTRYGMGFYVDRWRGHQRVYHGGDDAAHRSIMVYFPELDGGIVVLSNDASFNQYAVADQLAEVVFPELLRPEDAADARILFNPDDFDVYAGRYELESTPGFVFTFRRDGDRLLSEAAGDVVELKPLSESEFGVVGQDARIGFYRDASGAVTSATIFHQGAQRLRRLSEDEVVGSRSIDLGHYAGRFYSEELETYYDLRVESETLVLRHRLFKGPVHLRPMQGERFSGSGPVASLKFERGAQGQVRGFRVGEGADREYVWFERKE